MTGCLRLQQPETVFNIDGQFYPASAAGIGRRNTLVPISTAIVATPFLHFDSLSSDNKISTTTAATPFWHYENDFTSLPLPTAATEVVGAGNEGAE
ncbi:hypothetical protein TIFTF001_039364, partial [Ficus carica]